MAIRPLSAERHGALRLRPRPDTAHGARQQHAVLGLSEIPLACADYPLALMKDAATGAFTIVALFGFWPGTNLYVQEGRWLATWVPGTMLRFPFYYDEAAPYGLAIDEECGLLGSAAGEPLFDAGNPTDFTHSVAASLAALVEDVAAARRLAQTLAAHGLVQPLALLLADGSGHEHQIDGLYSISEQALDDLDDAAVVALHRQGVLSAASRLGASLGQLERLRQLHDHRADRPIAHIAYRVVE